MLTVELDGYHRPTNPKKGYAQMIITARAKTEDHGPEIADEWCEDGKRAGFPQSGRRLAFEDGRRASRKGGGVYPKAPEVEEGRGLGVRTGRRWQWSRVSYPGRGESGARDSADGDGAK